MINIRCIAIDDEPPALRVIKAHMSKIPFAELVATTTNPIEGIQLIKDNKVDVLFLDIQMPQLTGIELLNTIKDIPIVIFTTAYKEYAVESYEHNALDYLLKPISFDRFMGAMIKAQDLLSNKTEASEAVPASIENNYIFIKADNKSVKVNLNEILYFEGLRDYVIVKTKDDKHISLLKMKDLEQTLPSNNFIRVHRSYIIAIDKISSFDKKDITIEQKEIPIGESYLDKFKSITDKFRLG